MRQNIRCFGNCGKLSNGAKCNNPSDCTSGNCVNQKCVTAGCSAPTQSKDCCIGFGYNWFSNSCCGDDSNEKEFKEASCSDKADNDCDGAKDLDDPDCCPSSTKTIIDSTAYLGGIKTCTSKSGLINQLGISGENACAWGNMVQRKSTVSGKETSNGGTCSDGIDNDCDGKTDNGIGNIPADEDCCNGAIRYSNAAGSNSIAWSYPSGKCCGATDCLAKDGTCKPQGSAYLSLNSNGNDNSAFCYYYGPTYYGWIDCDRAVPSCGESKCGSRDNVYTGEIAPHGEYTGSGSYGCCGDDSNEYYAAASNSKLCPGVSSTKPVCCDNPNDKVDSNGKCVPAYQCPKLINAAACTQNSDCSSNNCKSNKVCGEERTLNQACVNSADCASNICKANGKCGENRQNNQACTIANECQNGFCVIVPGQTTGKCSSSVTICGDGYCDEANSETQNTCAQDCCINVDGDSSQNCCSFKNGIFASWLPSNKCCGDDADDANQVQLYDSYNVICSVNLPRCSKGWQWDLDSTFCSSGCVAAQYSPGTEPSACCGDNPGEYYKDNQPNKARCCNAIADCVDNAGKCQSGTESTTAKNCADSIDNDCDGKTDEDDEECCSEGDKNKLCCNKKTGEWLNKLGIGTDNNCCGDTGDEDYGIILTDSSSRQYLCATLPDEPGASSWIDASGNKVEISFFKKLEEKIRLTGRTKEKDLGSARLAVQSDKSAKATRVQENENTQRIKSNAQD
ncbi:hypothetical protein J4206_04625 [Candidatus Woesearchaeota archaeon]|nr:hypothetical protein [Candidatus Woesearchaeota archaeon]